jgi:hypothetical protein
MSLFSESIAQKLRLSANRPLAERYIRRKIQVAHKQDGKGVTVNAVRIMRLSNGLLDD